jgi:hypothetical protein
LIQRKLPEVHAVLTQAGSAIEQWSTGSVSSKESLRVFFLVLQVCHYLLCGQACILVYHYSFSSVFSLPLGLHELSGIYLQYVLVSFFVAKNGSSIGPLCEGSWSVVEKWISTEILHAAAGNKFAKTTEFYSACTNKVS